MITVIDTIVLIPAKPILPLDTEYNSITSGILGNYYYVFHALEVVNVSLLGIHSKTITHMRKPSQSPNRRKKIFDSFSISYDMTETSKDEMTENDRLKRNNSFLSVNHSIHWNESHLAEMSQENGDPSIINCQIIQSKSVDDQIITNNSYLKGLNLPTINIESHDEVISHRQYIQSKNQDNLSTLNGRRQTRSLSLDADPLYLVDPNSVLDRIQSFKQTTNNDNCEMDSFVTKDLCPTSPPKELNTGFDGDEQNIDVVSIHSLATDSFEPQSLTDYSIKDTNDGRNLPPSPTSTTASRGGSISSDDLNAVNKFTDCVMQELPTTADQQSEGNVIQSSVQSESLTSKNVQDSNHVDSDYNDSKSDNKSITSVVLANKDFTSYINYNLSPLDTMNKVSNGSCPQSPTQSITSINSNISGHNFNALFSDTNPITKHKRMTVDDGLLYNSTGNYNQAIYRIGLGKKKKSNTQPPSPVESVSSTCSSISAHHLHSLFDNHKFRQQFSNLKVDKKSIAEWIANQQQYLHLCQQQSDDIQPTTINLQHCSDTNNCYSSDNGDPCHESINSSHSGGSNGWSLQAMIATTETDCNSQKDDIEVDDIKSSISNSDTAYNPSHQPAKSNNVHEDTVSNPLTPHLDPNDEAHDSSYQIRKTTTSTTSEECNSYGIPDIIVTITNREEDIKVLSMKLNLNKRNFSKTHLLPSK